MGSSAEMQINKQTSISLGLVVTIIGLLTGALVGVWNVSKWMSQVDLRLDNIERGVANGGEDRWTGTAMRIWAEELGIHNPELSIPDVERLRGIIPSR